MRGDVLRERRTYPLHVFGGSEGLHDESVFCRHVLVGVGHGLSYSLSHPLSSRYSSLSLPDPQPLYCCNDCRRCSAYRSGAQRVPFSSSIALSAFLYFQQFQATRARATVLSRTISFLVLFNTLTDCPTGYH